MNLALILKVISLVNVMMDTQVMVSLASILMSANLDLITVISMRFVSTTMMVLNVNVMLDILVMVQTVPMSINVLKVLITAIKMHPPIKTLISNIHVTAVTVETESIVLTSMNVPLAVITVTIMHLVQILSVHSLAPVTMVSLVMALNVMMSTNVTVKIVVMLMPHITILLVVMPVIVSLVSRVMVSCALTSMNSAANRSIAEGPESLCSNSNVPLNKVDGRKTEPKWSVLIQSEQ